MEQPLLISLFLSVFLQIMLPDCICNTVCVQCYCLFIYKHIIFTFPSNPTVTVTAPTACTVDGLSHRSYLSVVPWFSVVYYVLALCFCAKVIIRLSQFSQMLCPISPSFNEHIQYGLSVYQYASSTLSFSLSALYCLFVLHLLSPIYLWHLSPWQRKPRPFYIAIRIPA